MSDIQYPLRLCRDEGTIEVHIRDATNRVIAAHLIGRDAQELVDCFNGYIESKGKLPIIGLISRKEWREKLGR